MKTIQKFRILIPLMVLVGITLFSGMQCEKDFPPGTPEIDKLPKITQTGANTFGCLVDGEAFVAQKYWYSEQPALTASYQFINGVWYLQIGASNTKLHPLPSIHIVAVDIEIKPQKYELSIYNTPGYFSAVHQIIDNGLIDTYKTSNSYKGEIEITNIDLGGQIISGIFWFDAVNKDGKLIKVREGRFDLPFAI